MKQFRGWGVMGDWENFYCTMGKKKNKEREERRGEEREREREV